MKHLYGPTRSQFVIMVVCIAVTAVSLVTYSYVQFRRSQPRKEAAEAVVSLLREYEWVRSNSNNVQGDKLSTFCGCVEKGRLAAIEMIQLSKKLQDGDGNTHFNPVTFEQFRWKQSQVHRCEQEIQRLNGGNFYSRSFCGSEQGVICYAVHN